MATIWGKPKNRPAEQIDTFRTLPEAKKMLAEYRMAFGLDWDLWIGMKHSEPVEED